MTADTVGPDRLIGVEIGGKYRIVRLLGEGGMGCVYQGEQKLGATIRKVAIKTLHQHLSHDPQILARFEREVGTVAGLQHPNTIQVYDFGKMDDGTLYIVMEFVEGQSVAAALESGGPMEPARVSNIMKQVCGSLEEAHGLGIVHRDLKPDNIVLCEKAGQHDWVEVLDFGIAKRSSETDEREQKLTQQGMVLGTPPYMSPEQFTGKPVDRRSDIYSLGVMAYEMLTGGLPFTGNTAWEWATAHMTAQPRPLETFPVSGRIPPAMKSAILRALEKDPNRRFPTVTEFFGAFSSADATAPAPYGHVPTQPGAPMDPMVAGMAPMGAMGMGPAPYPSGPQPYPTGPQPSYGTPPQGSHSYTPQPFPQMMTPAPVAPRKSGAGIIVAVLAVLVLFGGLAVAGVVLYVSRANASAATTDTATATVAATAPPTATATATATATDSTNLASLTPDATHTTNHAVAPAPTIKKTTTHPATTAPVHTAPVTYTETQPTSTATTTYTPSQPTYTAPTATTPPANDPPECMMARRAREGGAHGRILNDLVRRCMKKNGGVRPF
jgi:serine/threonine protein kinase